MIKNSTQLIEATDRDYKMLKEKGKEGEEVLHYHGFLDGYANGYADAKESLPGRHWHKVAEGDLPQESETDVILIYNGKIQFALYLPQWGFSPIYVFDTEGNRKVFQDVSHWMEIPDVPKV